MRDADRPDRLRECVGRNDRPRAHAPACQQEVGARRVDAREPRWPRRARHRAHPGGDVDLAAGTSVTGSTSWPGIRGAPAAALPSTAWPTSTATSPSPIRRPTRPPRSRSSSTAPRSSTTRARRPTGRCSPTSRPSTPPTTSNASGRRSARTRSRTSGFSYGSELGATYATLFGKHIRAMVLDGAIDPDLDGVETARRAGGRRRARARLVPRRLLLTSHVRVQQQRQRRGCVRHAHGEARLEPAAATREGSARGRAGCRVQRA